MSYHTKSELLQLFANLEDKHKDQMSHETFGKSVQNNDLHVFKIGNIRGGIVMIDAACHGNERATSELLYLYAKWLLESDTDEAKRILSHNLTLLIPIVNTDKFPTVRKNVNGVDLNRNFDWNWGGIATTGGGVSDDPTHPNYRGTAPLTEPECQAFKFLWNKYKPVHYLNTHTGGAVTVWYSRWAKQEDKQYMIQVFKKYSDALQSKGLTPPILAEDGGTGNFNSTPYHTLGIFGWCCEFYPTVGATPSYDELPALLEYWLPFLVILSDESYEKREVTVSELVNIYTSLFSVLILLDVMLPVLISKIKEVK